VEAAKAAAAAGGEAAAKAAETAAAGVEAAEEAAETAAAGVEAAAKPHQLPPRLVDLLLRLRRLGGGGCGCWGWWRGVHQSAQASTILKCFVHFCQMLYSDVHFVQVNF
jgi:hypothetical protein